MSGGAVTFYYGLHPSLRYDELSTVEYRARDEVSIYHLWLESRPVFLQEVLVDRQARNAIGPDGPICVDGHTQHVLRGPILTAWFSGIGMTRTLGQPLEASPDGFGVKLYKGDLLRLVFRSLFNGKFIAGTLVAGEDLLDVVDSGYRSGDITGEGE